VFHRNPDEVQHIFTAPIELLQEVEEYEHLGDRGAAVATYSHPAFPARIWGLTAHLSDTFLKTVLRPAIAEFENASESDAAAISQSKL